MTWQPISTAPKDGTYILATIVSDDAVLGETSARYAGRSFVIRHEGKTPSDYDLGWALYPGFGGVPDHWFARWMPLPESDKP